MISSISRHLARTSSVAAASKFIRPAVSTTQQTNFSQRAFSSDSEEKSFGLSRKDISNIVSAEYGMSGAEAKRIVDTVFDTMVESLSKKESVAISKFGKFKTVDVPAREYNNPSNPGGAKVSKGASVRVKFQPYTHLKDCVAEGKFEK